MKEPVQKPKEAVQQQKNSAEGGQSMTPPAFGLSAEPVQAKTADGGPIQMVKDRSEQQEKLRQEFESYRDIKSGQIQDAGQKSAFVSKANSFIQWADERSGWFNGHQRWGNDDYKKKLGSQFSDYQTVLSGKIAELKSAALQDAEAALTTAQASVARAQVAVDQAVINTSAAEKAAAEAEIEAQKAELAATTAEANAALPDAGEPEKLAAKKAREAANAARKAADAAKAAVEKAKASQELASEQKSFADGQLSHAAAVVERTKDIGDIKSAERQKAGAASMKSATESFSSSIETTISSSNAAKSEAETASATAKTEAGKAHSEELRSKATEGIKDKFKALDDAKDEKARLTAAKDLMTFVRGQVGQYPQKITDFKKQPTPSNDEKVRIIGQVAALAARAEWLIGSIYLGGSDDKKKWESSKNNDKDKVLAGYYQKNTGSDAGSYADDPWCTKFLGTVYKQATGLHTKSGGTPNGELWSGYKLGRGDYFDYGTEGGGKHVGKSDQHAKGKDQDVWVRYTKSLRAEKDAEKRKELADAFLKDHITPQAGDAMIVKRGSAKDNSFTEYLSHTTMVEKLDGHTIYTIEGNASDRVLGRSYDLTNADDVAKIIFISRFSIDSYGEKEEKPKEGEAAKPFTGTVVTEEELLAPMRKMVEMVTAYAQEKKYIAKLEEDELDVVKNLQSDNGTAKDT